MAFRSRGAHFLLGRDRRDRAPGWGSCTQPPALHLVHFAQISGLTPKSGDLFFLLLQSLWDATLHRGLVPVIHPNTSGSSSPPGTAPPWPLSHLFPFPPSPPAPPGGLGGAPGLPRWLQGWQMEKNPGSAPRPHSSGARRGRSSAWGLAQRLCCNTQARAGEARPGLEP